MSLRLTVSAAAGAFLRAMTEGERPIAKAAAAPDTRTGVSEATHSS
jgi:hypothetical protein